MIHTLTQVFSVNRVVFVSTTNIFQYTISDMVGYGRCLGQDEGCCTSDQNCDYGEGDCDSDDECAIGLVCGDDNCLDLMALDDANFDSGDDCCVPSNDFIKLQFSSS